MAGSTTLYDRFINKKPADVPQAYWERRLRELDAGESVPDKKAHDLGWIQDEVRRSFQLIPEGERQGYLSNLPTTVEGAEAEARGVTDDAIAKSNAAWDTAAGLGLNELMSVFGVTEEEAQKLHEDFANAANSYEAPPIPAELAEIVSQAAEAKADPESIAAQKDALGKVSALTGIEETAEEKFMREQARRTQERDLRSQREADRTSLLSRGAYGSGAEIAMNAAAQQEAAERRSLEELGANANAQKRALAAIGEMGSLAGQIRDQSFNEQFRTGSAADTVRNWNREYKEDHNRWVADKQRQAGLDKIDIAGKVKESGQQVIGQRDRHAVDKFGARTGLASGVAGNAMAGAGMKIANANKTGSRLYGDQIRNDMEGDEGWDPLDFANPFAYPKMIKKGLNL